MDLIRQYNRLAGENKSLIAKALTSASGVGEALVPQHLEQIITNTLPRLSPALAMITPKFDNQKYHEFNRLTALPSQGGAMGESATTPTYSPTFQRTGVYLKVIRRKGATTDFLQDASKKNIDSAATNIEACILSHIYDLENYIFYGNSNSNTYEFSGLDTLVTTNRVNQAYSGAVPTTLQFLDDMLDTNLDLQGINHKKAFVMSPYMLSLVSRLLTNVRLNQSQTGQMTQVDIGGGWRLNAYRDVPIIVSSACRPKTQMGVVSTATATSGGSIADASHNYFQVAAVTINGEQLACTEVDRATSGGNTSTITLSWTAVTGAFRYKIYYGATSGTETLISVIPGFTYDANGTITGSTTTTINTNSVITSNASGQTQQVVLKTVSAHTEVPTGMQSDRPLNGSLTTPAIPEYVFLWDLDEFQGLGRLAYTNEGGSRFNGLVTIEDLAKTDDFLPFMIKTYCALADSYEATSVVNRGLRVV